LAADGTGLSDALKIPRFAGGFFLHHRGLAAEDRIEATFDHMAEYGVTDELGDGRIGELGYYLGGVDAADDSRHDDELALKALGDLDCA
jgi:hypothetical protein